MVFLLFFIVYDACKGRICSAKYSITVVYKLKLLLYSIFTSVDALPEYVIRSGDRFTKHALLCNFLLLYQKQNHLTYIRFYTLLILIHNMSTEEDR